MNIYVGNLPYSVTDDELRAAFAEFGEQGLIELVGIVGYYCLVSLTLNAFEVPLTGSMQDPFPDD